MKRKKIFTLLFLLLLGSCASYLISAWIHQPTLSDNGQQVYYRIKEVLNRDDGKIDYDTLLWVHQEMILKNRHIQHSGELVKMLIEKKNDRPRVDNMILIYAADIIGNSQVAIDDVAGLFRDMLMQDQRLNSWVLAYIGDAIGKYKYDMPEGDLLADLLEQRVAEKSSNGNLSKEFFGHHFLPPPKEEYLINYIANIEDQKIRGLERNCYYSLVKSEWSEAQIEKALRQLQSQGVPGTGEKTQRPMKYLILHPDQFENPSTTPM